MSKRTPYSEYSGVKGEPTRRGRKIPLILLSAEFPEMIGIPPFLFVNENTTFGKINRDLYSLTGNKHYKALQETLGPRPRWAMNESEDQIPRTTTRLFVINTASRVVIGVVRSSWDDYPMLLEIPSNTTSMTVWELIQTRLAISTGAETVTLYNGSEDVRYMFYDHVAMEKMPSFPTVFFITLNPATKRVWQTDWTNLNTTALWKLQLSRCQHLVDTAKFCKFLTVQCLHVAEGILHMLIGCAAGRTPPSIFTFNGLFNYLDQLFDEINQMPGDSDMLSGLRQRLDLVYFACCSEFPGSIDIRRSFADYIDYGQIDVSQCERKYGFRYETLPLSVQWDVKYLLIYDQTLIEADPILDDESLTSSEEGHSSPSDIDLRIPDIPMDSPTFSPIGSARSPHQFRGLSSTNKSNETHGSSKTTGNKSSNRDEERSKHAHGSSKNLHFHGSSNHDNVSSDIYSRFDSKVLHPKLIFDSRDQHQRNKPRSRELQSEAVPMEGPVAGPSAIGKIYTATGFQEPLRSPETVSHRKVQARGGYRVQLNEFCQRVYGNSNFRVEYKDSGFRDGPVMVWRSGCNIAPFNHYVGYSEEGFKNKSDSREDAARRMLYQFAFSNNYQLSD